MRRRLSIVLAALVAVGSGLGLFGYVRSADARAKEGVDLVPVLVVIEAVPTGTSFAAAWDSGLIGRSETLRHLLPPSAILDPSPVVDFVALHDLAAGEVIIASMFGPADGVSAPKGPPTFATQVPEGQVAVSFAATAEQAVGNLIQPGDSVNIIVQLPEAADLGLPPSNGPAMVHAFQSLRVIAIGTTVADPNAEVAAANPGTGIYTVAVPPEDSARLLYLTQQYPVFLTLVAATTSTGAVPAVPPVDAANSLPGTGQ